MEASEQPRMKAMWRRWFLAKKGLKRTSTICCLSGDILWLEEVGIWQLKMAAKVNNWIWSCAARYVGRQFDDKKWKNRRCCRWWSCDERSVVHLGERQESARVDKHIGTRATAITDDLMWVQVTASECDDGRREWKKWKEAKSKTAMLWVAAGRQQKTDWE